MSAPLPPAVRLMFVCDKAVFSTAWNTWELTGPWSVVALPPGVGFPFRHEGLWVYAQLTDGLGTFDLRVEMRQLLDGGGYRAIAAVGVPVRMTFTNDRRIVGLDQAFVLRTAPFREPGLYELYLSAENGRTLEGDTAMLRVLGPEGLA